MSQCLLTTAPLLSFAVHVQEAAVRAADPDGASAEERAQKKATDAEAWFNVASVKPTAHKQGIGKYIQPQQRTGDAAAAAAAEQLLAQQQQQGEAATEPPKKRAKAGGFGSFDAW